MQERCGGEGLGGKSIFRRGRSFTSKMWMLSVLVCCITWKEGPVLDSLVFLQHVPDLHPESYFLVISRFQIWESEPFFARRERGYLPVMGSVHVNALKG